MIRFVIITSFLLVITSCAPMHVNYDFEKGTDFSKYKTYSYFGDLQTGLSELDNKRFLDALDANMATKGFSFSETPDFLVDIKSNEYQQVQRNNVGIGLGGGGGNVGGGISIGLPIGQANITKQITIDFVDNHGKGLFWQARAETSFNPNATPEKREQLFNTLSQKVLSKYPPKQ